VSGSPAGVPDLQPQPGRSTQVVPNGVRRIGGDRSVAASGDGQDPPGLVLPGVAVLDSTTATHPDLNVVGGKDCANEQEFIGTYDSTLPPDPPVPPHDPEPLVGPLAGHGLNTAGVIGAMDNDFGVVGVAPGAPIYAYRVVRSDNTVTTASVLCALAAVKSLASSGLVKVVNMSFTMEQFAGLSDPNCAYDPEAYRHNGFGWINSSGISGQKPRLTPEELARVGLESVRRLVCDLVAAGVTVVASAANDSADVGATGSVPAVFDEVITVSGLADSDGVPGGVAAGLPEGCPAVADNAGDDVFGSFSDFGSQVDLIAPGTCLLTTSANGQYDWYNRTSGAAPHVAGAAALHLAQHPAATPAEVKAALIGSGTLDWNPADDPDGVQEPLVNVGLCPPPQAPAEGVRVVTEAAARRLTNVRVSDGLGKGSDAVTAGVAQLRVAGARHGFALSTVSGASPEGDELSPWLEDLLVPFSDGTFLVPGDAHLDAARSATQDAGLGVFIAGRPTAEVMARAAANGLQARQSAVYVEGGNLLTTRAVDGSPLVLVGRSSLHVAAFQLQVQGCVPADASTEQMLQHARMVLATELGVATSQVVDVADGGYHIDMIMRPGPDGVVLVDDRQTMVDAVQVAKQDPGLTDIQRTLLDSIDREAHSPGWDRRAAVMQQVRTDLEAAGMRVVPVPGVASGAGLDVNFMNGLMATDATGQVYYLTNDTQSNWSRPEWSAPGLERAFQASVAALGIQVEFLSTSQLLSLKGGLDCATVEHAVEPALQP
jgi:subtilisin